MKTYVNLWKYIAVFFLQWKTFQANVVEKIKNTHAILEIFFFRKSCSIGDDLEKYDRDKQALNEQYKSAHKLCMQDN